MSHDAPNPPADGTFATRPIVSSGLQISTSNSGGLTPGIECVIRKQKVECNGTCTFWCGGSEFSSAAPPCSRCS